MGVGSLESKLYEHALCAQQRKTTSTCNGARIARVRLSLTQ